MMTTYTLCLSYTVSCACVCQVWDPYGRLLYQSAPFDAPVTSVAWNPSGDCFAVGAFDTLQLCDAMGWAHSKVRAFVCAPLCVYMVRVEQARESRRAHTCILCVCVCTCVHRVISSPARCSASAGQLTALSWLPQVVMAVLCLVVWWT